MLEDLQWSDRSTVDLLASLVQELRGHGLVRELPLELLSAADVAAYLAGRLGGSVAPSYSQTTSGAADKLSP